MNTANGNTGYQFTNLSLVYGFSLIVYSFRLDQTFFITQANRQKCIPCVQLCLRLIVFSNHLRQPSQVFFKVYFTFGSIRYIVQQNIQKSRYIEFKKDDYSALIFLMEVENFHVFTSKFREK